MEYKGNIVSLDKNGIKINGKYTILMCASLFYFRIPPEMWIDRMRKIKLAGYNCIDVYFPWNFHEVKKGEWLFDGDRNVERFLELANQEGLFVVARPGPYICSEWDGGGLPAYLFAEDVNIRENDARYLKYVEEWFKRILPIISRFQLTQQGSVVLVQLENELDFFECKDRVGYMNALKSMADKYGIEVPCVACAGQGDIYGAGGDPKRGVIPAFNLYVDPAINNLEKEIKCYTDQMRDLNVPFMITETGRNHLLLRRLLSSGAKLIGAYNQVGGTDFGFTTSINNWGDPVSFQTTNYGFNSLIDAFGRVGDEFKEARLLGKFLNTMGESLARASMADGEAGISIEADIELPYDKPPVSVLLQEERGYVIPITNTAQQTMHVKILADGKEWPVLSEMSIEGRASRFALLNFSMGNWLLPGRIVFSSAEPIYVSTGNPAVIVFHANGTGEVHLAFESSQGTKTFTFLFNDEKREELTLENGQRIILYGLSSSKAAMLSKADSDGIIYLPDIGRTVGDKKPLVSKWATTKIAGYKLLNQCEVYKGQCPVFMEKANILRGYANYKARVDDGVKDVKGLLVHHGADVISVYIDDQYIGTVTPAGGYAFLPLQQENYKDAFEINIRSEIWGHSNFDDIRKPALRIKSMRGIDGLTLVKRIKSLPFWLTSLEYRQQQPYDIKLPFGGWLTTRKPVNCRYSCSIYIPVEYDSFFLEFRGIKCQGMVEINGEYIGDVDEYNDYLDISQYVIKGGYNEISVRLKKRYYNEPAGHVAIMMGTIVKDWSLYEFPEAAMWNAACATLEENHSLADLPIELEPGSIAWFSAEINTEVGGDSYAVYFYGENLKITVLFNERIVGRLWLPSPNRPAMVGGTDNVAYLPGRWFRDDGKNKIILLVEAIAKDKMGVISAIDFLAI